MARDPRPDPGAEALEEAVALALRVLQGALALLLVAFLGSGFFTVGPNEVAFVRRFGVLDPEPLGPGGHWSWHAILFEEARVDVGGSDTVATTAFDLRRSDEELLTGRPPAREGGLDAARDGSLLTGDANLVHVTLAARVAVAQPYRTLVAAADPDAVVAVLLERAAVRAAAGRGVEGVLGAGRAAFSEAVARELAASLGQGGADAGLRVEAIERVRDLAPPPQVRDAFDGVARAAQTRDRLRSEALGDAARLRGEAAVAEARLRGEAASRAALVREEARTDAAVLTSLLDERRRDPRGLERRLLAATLAEAVGRIEEAFLVAPGPLRLRLRRDTRHVAEELERATRAELGLRPADRGEAAGGGR